MLKNIYFLFKACRPLTLVVATFPVSLAFSLCINQKLFEVPNDLIIVTNILVVAILIQIISNLANDYFDFRQGEDQKLLNRQKLLTTGRLSLKLFKIFLFNMLGLTILAALPLVILGGLPILVIGLSALFFAFLYSATKFSLARNYLSELLIFLFFGPIATAGTYFLLTNVINLSAIILGISSGLLGIALLEVNNLRDLQSDLLSGRRNLVTLLGVQKNKKILRVIYVLAPLFLIALGWNMRSFCVIALGLCISLYLNRILTKEPENYKKLFIGTIYFITILQLAIFIDF